MANCDIQALLAAGSCFQCLPPGQQAIVELSLLCSIMQNGGGGGGGSGGVSSGAGDPVAAPTNVNIDNIYVNRTAVPESGWLWPAGGAAWEQIF